MKKYLFGILFLIVFFAGTSFAAKINFLMQSTQSPDIYLDNDGTGGDGSDENPYGLFSEITEINWATIAASINSGTAVNIYLKRGVEWNEQLTIGAIGSPDRPITIKAYGTGEDPIINGLSIVVVNPSSAQPSATNTPIDIYLDNNGSGGDGSIDEPYGPFTEINWTTISASVNSGTAVNIYLKCDAVWTEPLTIGAIGDSKITIQSYGTGEEPIINGLSFGVEYVEYPGDDYCTENNPCSEGEGDCDGDSQCESGLICAQNVGANYGWNPLVDVCEN